MIPNFLRKQKIPTSIPNELKTKITEFSKAHNKEEFLKKAFFYIVNERKGSRINLILKFNKLFSRKIKTILHSKGYMHYTTMNYLLRVIAVKSELFKDEDIKLCWTHTWYIAPHQYLKIKIHNNKFITLDPWNYQYGIDFGKYGKGFDSKKFKPIR